MVNKPDRSNRIIDEILAGWAAWERAQTKDCCAPASIRDRILLAINRNNPSCCETGSPESVPGRIGHRLTELLGRLCPSPAMAYATVSVLVIAIAVSLTLMDSPIPTTDIKPGITPESAGVTALIHTGQAWLISGKDGDEHQPVSDGQRINRPATFITGALSRLELVEDGRTIHLSTDSSLTYHSAGQVEYLGGIVRFVIESGRGSFRVRTGETVISVIGTEFEIREGRNGGITVLLEKGRLRIQSEGETVNLVGGYGLNIPVDGRMSSPFTFSVSSEGASFRPDDMHRPTLSPDESVETRTQPLYRYVPAFEQLYETVKSDIAGD